MPRLVEHKAWGPPPSVWLPSVGNLIGGAASLAGGVARGAGEAVSGAAGAAAAGAGLTLDAIGALAKGAIAVAAGVPLAVGVGMGVARSKVTSPTMGDLKDQEQTIVNARLEAMASENIRRLAADMKAYRDAKRRMEGV